ncbi:MAG: NAD(P)H-dependent oxidoreductase [Lutibacter sp.]|nr:NAD(P)H-dependent oxidoreductase [Lutibacter sp.]
MDIIRSLEWRYATKKFDPSKKLTTASLEVLKKAFNLTATSYGLQPLKMLVIENPALRQELLTYAYQQRQVVEASHLLVICIEKETSTEDIHAHFDLEKSVRGLDESVIASFRAQLVKIYENLSAETRQLSAKHQAYIALGNLLTVCAVEKIDACPMEGFMPDKFDELLKLNTQNLRSVLLLPVGYRAEDDQMKDLKKVRKPINETVIDIK